MTFGAYTIDDLTCIVKGRIGPNIMEDKAIEFVAKSAASCGGDARKALELASRAVQHCLELLAKNNGGSETSAASLTPLVTLKHVFAIQSEQNRTHHKTIEGLPADGKAALCVLSVLSQNDVTYTTLGKLRSFTLFCLEEFGLGNMISEQDFKLLLETLENSSLLRLGDPGTKKSSAAAAANNPGVPILQLFHTPVCIGPQAADIVKAVQSVLGKIEFYQKLMATTQARLNELQ